MLQSNINVGTRAIALRFGEVRHEDSCSKGGDLTKKASAFQAARRLVISLLTVSDTSSRWKYKP